jgi:hypothetical protein
METLNQKCNGHDHDADNMQEASLVKLLRTERIGK